MDRNGTELMKGMSATREDYEFAELPPEDVKKIADTEKSLSQDKNTEIILLAYEKRKH
ncbi:MAG: hypothetical protein ACM3TT_00425 [Syntrophothermus sp.]